MRAPVEHWKKIVSNFFRPAKKPAACRAPVLAVETLEPRSMLAVASITATDPAATELGQTTGAFTVSLDAAAPSGGVSVNLEFSGASAGDYTSSSGSSAFIPEGETSAVVTITPNLDNDVEDGGETLICTLTSGSGYTVGSADEDSVSIADDPPVVSIVALHPYTFEAGGDYAQIEFRRTGGNLAEDIDVSFHLEPQGEGPFATYVHGSYTEGDFYPYYATFNSSAQFETTFGETEAFLVYPIDDDVEEGIEKVRLVLAEDPESYLINSEANTASAYIIDDELFGDETNYCTTCYCGCSGVSTGWAPNGAFLARAAGGILQYNSWAAQGLPVIKTRVPFDETAEGAEKIEAKLTFGELDPVSVWYDPSNLTPDELYAFAIPVDASGLEDGAYGFDLEIIEHYVGEPDVIRSFHGSQIVRNLASSPAGKGWTISAVDALSIGEDGVSWMQSCGSQIWFDDAGGGAFTGQRGDPDFSTLEFASGTYTLTKRSGEVLLFNSSGLLQSRTDAKGNATTYSYVDGDGDEEADEIATITDYAGRELNFTYDSGYLSEIEDFDGRVTTLEIVDGELLSVTEPDSNGEESGGLVPVTEFSYSGGVMASFTLPSGSETTLGWDHAGGLASRTNASEDSKLYQSEQTVAVVDTTGGYGGENDPAELFAASGVFSSETNEVGDVVQFTTDIYGYRTSETDPDAPEDATIRHFRNADGQVIASIGPGPAEDVNQNLSLDEFRALGLLVEEYAYEDGNLVLIVGPGPANGHRLVTEIELDATWNVPESVLTYDGFYSPAEALSLTLYTIDEETGDVLEVRRVRGEVDDEINEETDDALEVFTFTVGGEVGVDPPAGLVASHTNANGVTTLYDYNAHGLVIEITLAAGSADEATLGYEYDSADNLTAEIDELNRRTEHTWDLLGNRLSTLLPDPDDEGPQESTVLQWEYSVMGKPTLFVDGIGRETEYVYGAFGNLFEQTLSGEGFDPITISWGYDDAGRMTSSVDGLSRTTSYLLDSSGRTVETTLPDPGGEADQPIFSQTYAPEGYSDAQTDALGNVTTVELSNYGRTITTTSADPDGEGPASPVVTVQNFDLLGRLESEVGPNGGITYYEHDMLSRLVQKTLPDPGPEADPPVFAYMHDNNGNVLTATDALENTTLYVFDARDRMVALHLPDPATGESSEEPSYEWVFDAASQVTSETAFGRTTEHVYDGMGREIETVFSDPDDEGPLDAPTISRSFDAASRLILEVAPDGGETEYEYDLLDNVVLIRLADPDSEGGASRPELEFLFDAASQLVAETDAMGRTTLHTLDGLGREIETESEDPDAGGELEPSTWTRSFDANSNLVLSVDPLLSETAYEFDALNRRTKIIDPEEGETSFSFDASSNMTSLTDPEGNTTQWIFDGLNRVIEEENELEASRFFVYDAMSNLVEKTDRNGRVTQYVVDRRGRTTEENWMDGETVVRSFEFEFNDSNELLSVVDPDAEYGFVYDGLGRTTEITADLAGFTSSIVMAQTFDVSSNRTQLAVSIGGEDDFVNDYTFDGLSRMTRIERHGALGGNTVAETRIDLAYNAASQFTQIDRYMDLAGEEFAMSSAYAYDGMARLLSLDHFQGVTDLAGYAFTYDAASRITEIDSLIDGLTEYSYDTTSQLTAADFATQTDETHTWDANGNPDGGSFDVGPNNQVLSDGTYDYEYDGEGNRVLKTEISSGETTEYVWDYRNRLVNVITRDDEEHILQDVHYVYDFLNRWISREIDEDGEGAGDPTTEWFAFDGYELVLSFDDNAATAPDKRWLNGPAVDQYFAEENAENDVLLLLGDHLGTIRDTALYNSGTEETELKNHTLYTSFNARISDTDAAFASFIGETGRPHDAATGLDNHLNRWLDGWLKRWINEDPIGLNGDPGNVSRFVLNNPVIYVDPTGLVVGENLPAAEGRVTGEAIKEAIRNAGGRTEEAVNRTTTTGTRPGRVDARIGRTLCEIGPASPTGVPAKAEQLKSVGKGRGYFYRQRGVIPRAGDVVEYVELSYSQVQQLMKTAKDNGWTARQIWDAAKRRGSVMRANVSAKAAEAAGRLYIGGKQLLRNARSTLRCGGLPITETIFEAWDYLSDPYEFERRLYRNGTMIFPGMMIPPGQGNGGFFYTPDKFDREWANLG